MTLLAEAGAASRMAHAESASRADVARGRLRAVVARLRDGRSSVAAWLRVVRGRVAARLTATHWRRAVCFAAPPLALLLLPAMGLAYHVFLDRSGLPDIEPFIHFKPPTIGEVYDARGRVLIRLAREFRRVVSYDEVPSILRHAILSAEDKHFFTPPASTTARCPGCCRRARRAPWPGGEQVTRGSGSCLAKEARRSRSSSSAATSFTT